jgi:hypothetical protein
MSFLVQRSAPTRALVQITRSATHPAFGFHRGASGKNVATPKQAKGGSLGERKTVRKQALSISYQLLPPAPAVHVIPLNSRKKIHRVQQNFSRRMEREPML